LQRPSSSTHTSIFIHLQHLSSSTIFWSWNMTMERYVWRNVPSLLGRLIAGMW
jgi:hypothetical protein